MLHVVLSSQCSFLLPLLRAHSDNLSDKGLKVGINHKGGFHLLLMILKMNGVFLVFRHLDPCQLAIDSIAVLFFSLPANWLLKNRSNTSRKNALRFRFCSDRRPGRSRASQNSSVVFPLTQSKSGKFLVLSFFFFFCPACG